MTKCMFIYPYFCIIYKLKTTCLLVKCIVQLTLTLTLESYQLSVIREDLYGCLSIYQVLAFSL